MSETVFSDRVLVDGSANSEQLRVQGHTTQTESLQTWESNSASVLVQVTGDGRLAIGDDLGVATPDSMLEVHRAESPNNKPKRGIHSLGKITNALSDLIVWAMTEVELLGSAGVSGLQTTLRAKLTHSNTGTATTAELRAGDFQGINQKGTSGARVGRLAGLRGTASNDANAFADRIAGVEAAITNAAGGNVTDAAAIDVIAPVNSGTIANLYGLRIPDLSAGANNVAIQTGLGAVRFGDYMDIKRPVSVPGTPATDFLRVYPKSDGKLYAKNWSGLEVELGGSGSSGGGFGLSQGRLTLTSNIPVTTADVTAATTLYFTPYKGNRVALYNGTTWVTYTFSQISLLLSGLLANTNYDIFLYDNAGVLTLEATAWSNNTTRATALVLQDGIYVKTGALTRRYIGTIRTVTAGQSEDSRKRRFVYNEYNAVERKLYAEETTYQWSYTTNAWRAVNNNTNTRAEIVVGNVDMWVELDLVVRMTGAGSGGSHGFGFDTTTAVIEENYINLSNDGHVSAHLVHAPPIGYHYYQWIENGRGNTCYSFGSTTNAFRSGFTGTIRM